MELNDIFNNKRFIIIINYAKNNSKFNNKTCLKFIFKILNELGTWNVNFFISFYLFLNAIFFFIKRKEWVPINLFSIIKKKMSKNILN